MDNITDTADFEITNGILQMYRGTDTCVTVPEGVTTIAPDAFSYGVRIKSVRLPKSLKRVCGHAFSNISSLKEVIFSEGIRFIESGAFSTCVGLKSIAFPSTLESVGSRAFERCDALKEIKLPSNVKDIGDYAFCECNNLTRVTLPEGLSEFGEGAFANCISLKEISFPVGIEKMPDGVCLGCDSLCAVTLPKSIKVIPCRAFRGCKLLRRVSIPKSVSEIKDTAFSGCRGLRWVMLPSSLKSIGEFAFGNCRSLRFIFSRMTFDPGSTRNFVDIPEGCRIGSGAFNGCESLTDERGILVIGDCIYAVSWKLKEKTLTVPDDIKRVDIRSCVNIPIKLALMLPLHSFKSDSDGEETEFQNFVEIAILNSDRSIAAKYAIIPDLNLGGRDAICSTVKIKDGMIDEEHYDSFTERMSVIGNRLLRMTYRLMYPFRLSELRKTEYEREVRKMAYEICINMILRELTCDLYEFIKRGYVSSNDLQMLMEYTVANGYPQHTAVIIEQLVAQGDEEEFKL